MNRKTYLTFALSIALCFNMAIGQKDINLVPNPGFEQLNVDYSSWFYTGNDFTETIKFWSSPTYASPDIYGPQIDIPASWKLRGFGKVEAHSGNNHIGLTMYGCTNGKSHCREFVQIRLNESLVVGQTYQVQFFISRMDKTLSINNIGVSFDLERRLDMIDDGIRAKAAIFTQDILDFKAEVWRKVIFQFVATKAFDYMIIGNHFSDEKTKYIQHQDEDFNYAYYYFDDISLKKIPPYIDEVKVVESRFEPITKGDVIELDHVYFDYNDKEFLPSSHPQLDQLVALLFKYPSMVIKVEGHTDSRGDPEYNIKLSIERASAVREYLIFKGIPSNRLEYEGFGSSRPKNPKVFEENRRVEFRVLRT